ncbi:hypothetical protein FRC04_006940 [Tulasnella sp. 424]|nr:hypothetical protein FRC04_006940 [Tulasnella sp. 424]
MRRSVKVIQPGLVCAIEWRPVQMQHGLAAGAAPGSDEDLPAVYIAYHDYEQYSSIRNLRGAPNVVEKPPPDEMVLNEPPSPPPSQYPQRNRETILIIVIPVLDDDPLINSP